MTRVLVLGESGIVVPDEAVEAIEAISDAAELGAWLPSLVDSARAAGTDGAPGSSERRALRLRGGKRVEVPAAMSIAEVEILELPPLLRPLAGGCGVVGITQLAGGLGLVCDPRLLTLDGSDEEGRPS